MTQSLKTARAICKLLGFSLTYNRLTGEYRLCGTGKPESCAYYTPDLNDALETARVQAGKEN